MNNKEILYIALAGVGLYLAYLAYQQSQATNTQLTNLNNNVSTFSGPVNSVSNWFEGLFGSNNGNGNATTPSMV